MMLKMELLPKFGFLLLSTGEEGHRLRQVITCQGFLP